MPCGNYCVYAGHLSYVSLIIQVTIKKDMADDPSRNVICRCELVTEAEVPPAVADVFFAMMTLGCLVIIFFLPLH